MNVKSNLKKIPFVDATYRSLLNLPKYFSNKRILLQIASFHYPQLERLLTILNLVNSGANKLSESERIRIQSIENERKQLLLNTHPLIDGSLGEEGGLYDRGLTISRACEASKPPKPALMLYLITKIFEPLNIIELGTNVGVSAAYIATALKLNQKEGRLITLDASPYRQRVAKNIHSYLGLSNIEYVEGLFTDTLNQTLLEMGSVDLAFIDGHHQYQPTLDYFERILQFSSQNTVFVFDDIRWTDGMKKAWSEIREDERLGIVLDLNSVGICMIRQRDISERLVFNPIHLL